MGVSRVAVVARRPEARRGRAIRVLMLGGFTVTINEAPLLLPFSAQRLLAFLALHERPLTRPYVAGALWLDSPDQRSSASLRSALWRLRRVDPHLVEATDSHVRLGAGVGVDARELARAAARLLERGEPDAGDETALVAGDLLPDWYDEWIIIERERLRQLRLHALEALAEHLLARREYGRALAVAYSAIGAEPLRESAHRLVIRIHLAEGNRAEAARHLAVYETLVADVDRVATSSRLPGARRRRLAAAAAGAR